MPIVVRQMSIIDLYGLFMVSVNKKEPLDIILLKEVNQLRGRIRIRSVIESEVYYLFVCRYSEDCFRKKPSCDEAWPEKPHIKLFYRI